MKNKIILAILIGIALILLFYTRSQSLENICKDLDFSKCNSIVLRATTYYNSESEGEEYKKEFIKGDEEFSKLVDIAQSSKYKLTLMNLIAKNTTSSHRIEIGDFKYSVDYFFDNDILTINNFFGKITIYHNIDTYKVKSEEINEKMEDILKNMEW